MDHMTFTATFAWMVVIRKLGLAMINLPAKMKYLSPPFRLMLHWLDFLWSVDLLYKKSTTNPQQIEPTEIEPQARENIKKFDGFG